MVSEARTFFQDCIQAQIDKDRAMCREHHWKWNQRDFSSGYTIGDLIGAVMQIDNDADAQRFHEGYLEFLRWNWEQPNADVSQTNTPEQVALSNIGWCYGEGMSDERIAMWVRTTQAAHPVFGTMAPRPTPEEALEAGRRLGAR
jgi:hypothetical protein